jgi:DNA modification methylase
VLTFEVSEDFAMNPAFSTEYGAVYKTDCLKLFAALRDECIDTVFADPPFNLGKDYGAGADKDEWGASADYLKWCYGWMDEAVRVLKPGGAFFLYNLPQWPFHLAVHLEARRMTFRHWIAVSMKGTFPRARNSTRLTTPSYISRKAIRKRLIAMRSGCRSRCAGTAARTSRITAAIANTSILSG